MSIHSEHPFATPPEQREPGRRLRGRLPSPVTVFTSGKGMSRGGLTVSSLVVIQGDVPRLHAVLGPDSTLLDAIEETGKFVVQVLSDRQRGLADVFAGIRPAPGGMFAGMAATDTEWGPRLDDIEDWAGCDLEELTPIGDQVLISATIAEIHLSEISDPLVYFRGSYRTLGR